MNSGELPAWAFFIIFPVFAAFWCGMSYYLSYESGWMALAKKYRIKHTYSGEKSYLRSGKMGPTYFRSVLTIGVLPEGLYLAIIPPFNIGSPPLLIPWSKLHHIHRRKGWFLDQMVMDADDPKITTIRIDWEFSEKARVWIGYKSNDL